MKQNVFFRGEVRAFYSAEVVDIKTIFRKRNQTSVRCILAGEASYIRPHANSAGLTRELRFWLSHKESDCGNRVGISWDPERGALVISGESKFPVKRGEIVYFLPPEEKGQHSVYPVFSGEELADVLEHTESTDPVEPSLPPIPPPSRGHRWYD